MKKMLFVMDPIETINVDRDTTLAFMIEAQRRGYEPHYCQIKDLNCDKTDGYAFSQPAKVQRVHGAHASLGTPVKNYLHEFAAIWMRKDPPFDLDFFYATHLLERAEAHGTLVINKPSGLRACNEKLYIFNFPSVTPRTIVTKNTEEIRDFVDAVGGKAVLKPLDNMGGAGIFALSNGDGNFRSILEVSTDYGHRFVMLQEFIPEVSKGDKRVIVLNGEPIGALLRLPAAGEFRGNMASGGRAVSTEITDRDREIVSTIADRLRADGLWFVGLDVIDGRLTEVNVTSPTGLVVINGLYGLTLERQVLDWAEAKIATLR